jgi:selenide,water dikinase
VTGIIAPDRIITKGGAQPGDMLILTKPLGVGVITTALKRGQADPADVGAAIASMTQLNRDASHAARMVNVHAMTDITGYSLLGHAHEMAHLSNADFVLSFGALPWLPGAQRYARDGMFPGGAAANMDYFGQWTEVDGSIDDATRTLLFDPETSGGLLMSVAPAEVDALFTAFGERDVQAWRIGRVQAGSGRIRATA